MYVVLNRLRQYKEGVKNISHIHAVWKIIHPFLCQPIRDSIISLSHLTCMALFFIPFWFHHNLVYLFVFCFLKIGRWWLLGNCGDKRRQRWGLSSCRWSNRSITIYDSANLLKYLTKLKTIIFWLNHVQFFAFWFQRSNTMRLPCYWNWTFLPRTSYASYLAIPANTSKFLLMLIISFCMLCCTHSDTFCDF